jgi:hypothetical protein
MGQIPSTVGNSRYDAQEMPRLLWNRKVRNNPIKSVALTFRNTLVPLGEGVLTLRQTQGWKTSMVSCLQLLIQYTVIPAIDFHFSIIS